MTTRTNKIQTILLGTFLEESFDGLERLEAGLLHLDDNMSVELIDDLFRVMHSMKGGAGAIGVVEVGALAHAMENVLDGLRRGEPAGTEVTSLLLRGVDALRGSLRERQAGRAVAIDVHAEVTQAIERHAAGTATRKVDAPIPQVVTAHWVIDLAPHRGLAQTGTDPSRLLQGLAALGTIEVQADLGALPELAQLDPTECYLRWRVTLAGDVALAAIHDLFAWVEGECDVTVVRHDAPDGAAPSTPADASRPPAPPATAGADPAASASAATSSIRVGIDKIDQLMNMVGELVITQSMLGELDSDGPLDGSRLARIREGLGQLARNTRALQDSVMRLRSMPISTVFNRFPRLVRDLGQRLGKDIVLEITGQSTELDKAVLEKLGDPLIHLIRNSIDHGIEATATRLAAGKPGAGTIRLHAEHRGGDVIVEVSDDGQGLDPDRILATARQRGLIAADATLDHHAAIQLVFLPGFSTAHEVSDVSGRGVGMDVVRRHVKDLGGDISLDSERGRGVRVVLRLPLTLAIIDGQLIRLGDHQFVIPLLSIIESVAIDAKRKNRLGGVCDVYHLRDQLIPMVDLAALLGLPMSPLEHRGVMVVVVADGQHFGFVVDELMAQQQVVVKSLETNYQRVPGLAGATILGDGRVAFILDIIAVAESARATGTAAA